MDGRGRKSKGFGEEEERGREGEKGRERVRERKFMSISLNGASDGNRKLRFYSKFSAVKTTKTAQNREVLPNMEDCDC